MKLVSEWWAEMWPNMFAISVWTTLLFLWHHRSIRKHISREHERAHDRMRQLVIDAKDGEKGV
jgi:hypothetical protein